LKQARSTEFPDYRLDKQPVTKLAAAANRTGTPRRKSLNPRKLVVAQSIALQRKAPKKRLPMNHASDDLRIL
jgi:hypothetical protein